MTSALRNIPRGIWILAYAALALRVAFMVASVDLADDNYNEFGEIAKNMRAGHGYALFHFEGEMLSPWFSEDVVPFPSAYMPPAYVFYIYPFLSIADPVARNVLLLLIQHVAGALVVVLVLSFLSALYFPPAWASTRSAATMPRPSARGRIRSSTNFFRRLRDLSLR